MLRNLHLTCVQCSVVESMLKILQNFVAFSEYMYELYGFKLAPKYIVLIFETVVVQCNIVLLHRLSLLLESPK